jgi:outer membrane protein TolC
MGNISKILCCVLWMAHPAWGSELLSNSLVPGTSVQDLLQWQEQDSAELAAARYDTESAVQRAETAGALPDPSLRIEWQDVNGISVLPGQVGAMKYTVLQALPGWGKRAVQKQLGAAGVTVVREQQRATAAELRAQMKTAFVRYYQTHHALQLNEELEKFTAMVAQLAQSRYETGLATQQDLVRAQLEQSALQSERYALQATYSQSQARINALLNRPVYAALAQPAILRPLPPPVLLNETALEQRVRNNSPQLAGQAAQAVVAQSNVDLARKNLTPDFVLGVGPVQRGGSISTWDAMLEFSIPLQRGAHDAHQHEAGEMMQASLARHQVLESQLLGELREHYAALHAAQQQENLIHQRVLPLAELAFKGALAGYQSSRVDFATLLEAKRQLQKARLDELNASVEQQIHLAEIERLTGEEL